MNHAISKTKLLGILGAGLLAISSASVLIKLCQAPSLVIASYRLVLAAIFYLILAQVQYGRRWWYFSRPQWKLIFISGLFLTLHFATWIHSLKLTSVASSVVLVQSAPIFVALGGLIFLREKPTLLMWLGIFISLAGSILISLSDLAPGTGGSLCGNILAIGGAIGAAGYMLTGGRLRDQIDTIPYVAAVYSITAILLLSLAIFSGETFLTYNPNTYLLLIAIAIVPQIIGHTSINWSLKYLSATTVSVLILAEPIGASILAYFILEESLTWVTILGGGLILCGVTVVIFSTRKK